MSNEDSEKWFEGIWRDDVDAFVEEVAGVMIDRDEEVEAFEALRIRFAMLEPAGDLLRLDAGVLLRSRREPLEYGAAWDPPTDVSILSWEEYMDIASQ